MQTSLQAKLKVFNAKPPPGYVAGLGRGAAGFTTRSDIGPARNLDDEEGGDKEEGANPHAMPAPAPIKRPRPAEDGGDFSEANYDEFSGYGGSLFNDMPYEQDDQEADAVWEAIDEYMDERRKRRREEIVSEKLEKFRAEKPKIQSQFADCKRELKGISQDEWAALPESGEQRKSKRNFQMFTPTPDRLLQEAHARTSRTASFDTSIGVASVDPAAQTSLTPMADLTAMGEARGAVLSARLDKALISSRGSSSDSSSNAQVSDSVSGQTTVDPKGYLTSLSSLKLTSNAEISDIKKARLLLKSVTTTNPGHAPGWIAAARLEEVAQKPADARLTIAKGCQACPNNEDVWLEAARLNTRENAKAILAEAVRKLPKSVNIWVEAMLQEKDPKAKSRVLRRALEFIPNSVRLWRELVDLETDPDDARMILARAVECVPQNTDMWLALAKLEQYQNARRVLNRARQTIPTEPRIWISAAQLEEAAGHVDNIEKIIQKALKSLASHQVTIDRDQWLKEAMFSEKSGYVLTCQAIVKNTVGSGVEEEDRKRTWVDDAENAILENHFETARAIFAHALSYFPGKKSLWLRAADLERKHGNRDRLDQLLKRAVSYCPKAEVLWLMAAKEKWLAGDVDGARVVLTEAFAANPDSEQIWLAAVKIESESNLPDRARALLTKARVGCSTPRVWMKAALLEREQGAVAEELAILRQATRLFPDAEKLWLMLGQLFQRAGETEKCREAYAEGIRNNPNSVKLWAALAGADVQLGDFSRARTVLEKARLRNEKSPEIWLATVRAERAAGNQQIAENFMAKALRLCPTSGILWAEAISLESRPKQRSRSIDALKKCKDDPRVIVAVARLFWRDRKLDKARAWLTRTVKLDPDYGDAWAYLLRLEQEYGTEASAKAVVEGCVAAEPHHGELWQATAKDPDLPPRRSTEQILLAVASKASAS